MALGLAAATALPLVHGADCARRLRKLLPFSMAALAGLCAAPLGLALFFASRGALASLAYCVFQHNVEGTRSLWAASSRVLAFLVTLPLILAGGAIAARSTPDRSLAARRTLLFLTAAYYLSLLENIWPLVPTQDFLPLVPLLIVVLAGLVQGLLAWLASPPRDAARAAVTACLVLALAAALEMGAIIGGRSIVSNRTSKTVELLDEILRLTDPQDFVMDLKGETVFRRRPFYYVLEGVTKRSIREGRIADTISEQLVSTKTCVAVPDSRRFPPKARAFLRKNYLPVGNLRVAGRVLDRSGSSEPRDIEFRIEIPARYVFISGSSTAAGWLDGKFVGGELDLARGLHVFRALPHEHPLMVVWAQAIQRGFVPHPPERA